MGMPFATAVIYGVVLDPQQSAALFDELRKRYIAMHPGMTAASFDQDLESQFEFQDIFHDLFAPLSWKPDLFPVHDGNHAGFDPGQSHAFGIGIADDWDSEVAQRMVKANRDMTNVMASFQALLPVFQAINLPTPTPPDFFTFNYVR
jgi:hypothetical protein